MLDDEAVAVARTDALAIIKAAMRDAIAHEQHIIDMAKQLGRHPEDVRERARELGLEPAPPPATPSLDLKE